MTLANEFDDTIAGGASLEEAAAALDLPIASFAAVDRSGRSPDRQLVADLEPRQQILAEAFQLEPGSDSLLMETASNNGYFMVRVDAITPESATSSSRSRATRARPST